MIAARYTGLNRRLIFDLFPEAAADIGLGCIVLPSGERAYPGDVIVRNSVGDLIRIESHLFQRHYETLKEAA